MLYSYNDWPASDDPTDIGVNTAWEPIEGHKFPGGIKSGDVEVIFTYLVRQLDARVEPIEDYPPGDEWGYNFRPNRNNPDQLSCHASATAIDYNATQHPNKVFFTWTRDQVREIHKILNELDGVVKWLEGWDEMHFEIRGTTAQVRAVANKIRALKAPTQEVKQVALIIQPTTSSNWYVCDGISKRKTNQEEASLMAYVGLAKLDNGKPYRGEAFDDLLTMSAFVPT